MLVVVKCCKHAFFPVVWYRRVRVAGMGRDCGIFATSAQEGPQTEDHHGGRKLLVPVCVSWPTAGAKSDDDWVAMGQGGIPERQRWSPDMGGRAGARHE